MYWDKVSGMVAFKDAPEAEKLPEEEKDKIMHVSLPIGEGQMLMGTDTLESMGQSITMGNNMYISIHPDSKEEAGRLFNGLSAGGNIEMPLEKCSGVPGLAHLPISLACNGWLITILMNHKNRFI